jgi:hypothetical protein
MAPAEREAFAKNLEEHLNQRSRQGSSDDISMALVFGADPDYDAISLE